MKRVAFVMALLILAVGAIGVFIPSALTWLAQHVLTSGAFYVVAAIRVAFGLVLLSVASASRAPKTIRVLGCAVLIVGIATALTALMEMDRARAIIEWWIAQGSLPTRLVALVILSLGSFVAYACAPAARLASGAHES